MEHTYALGNSNEPIAIMPRDPSPYGLAYHYSVGGAMPNFMMGLGGANPNFMLGACCDSCEHGHACEGGLGAFDSPAGSALWYLLNAGGFAAAERFAGKSFPLSIIKDFSGMLAGYLPAKYASDKNVRSGIAAALGLANAYIAKKSWLPYF